MNIALHRRARTTPAIRLEIQQSKLSERNPAEKYGISRSTVRKWKYRDTTGDFSHRPHNLHATLRGDAAQYGQDVPSVSSSPLRALSDRRSAVSRLSE
jgi:hypothetical protein